MFEYTARNTRFDLPAWNPEKQVSFHDVVKLLQQ